MTPSDRFIEAAANTARQRDEWKARAEKAEAEVARSHGECAGHVDDSNRKTRELASQIVRAEKAEAERDMALNGFSKLVDASDAALVTISAERQRVTVALAAAQARERELRAFLSDVVKFSDDGARVFYDSLVVPPAVRAALSAPQDTTALDAHDAEVKKTWDEEFRAAWDAEHAEDEEDHPLADAFEKNEGEMGAQIEPDPTPGEP